MTPHRPSCRYLVAAGFVLALTGGALPLVLAGPASAASSPSGAAAVSSTNPASAGSVPPTTTAAGPTGASGPTTPSTTTPSTTTSSTTTPSTASTSSQTPSGVTTTTAAPTPQPKASTGLIGDGSSFAGPEILGWASDVFKAPYNLTINFTSDSSGQGRFDFGSGTVDFAVSDIPYQGLAFDTAQPSFKFIYVPVTAGGVAFMYHLNGLPSGTTLQLSSYTICAMMTGGITTWNNQYIQEDNPGVSLPATPIHPVIRSDLAGTNFVLQEYCIHEQPALWKAFIDATATQQYPGQVGDLSDSQPRSDWPLFPGAILASGSANAADDVANPKVDGYFTAVETTYAIQRGFPVASVKNASGAYTQPSAVGVASALAYATQNSNGTHNLNFDGIGPHVYNPSTYSYLLTPTQGWSAAKGATMSQFVNYALTLGQQKAPQIGYASLGLSLEQYGVNAVKADVPGAVAVTSAETSAYQCGDLTPAEVQAGQTAPTCGVTNSNNSITPGQAAKGGGTSTTSAASHASTSSALKASSGKTSSGSGGSGGSTGNGTSSGGANPSVSLSGASSPSLATTGWSPLPVVVTGLLFVLCGWVVRRRVLARLR